MRRWHPRITTWSLACAGLVLAAAPAFAQSGGGMGSSGGSLGGSGGSSFGGSSLGGGASSGGGSSFFGGSSSSGGGSSFAGGSSFSGGGLSPGSQAATGSVPGRAGANNANAAIGATSFLGANYANPLAMGLGTGTTTTQGRFGAALYTITNSQTGIASVNSANVANNGFGAGFGVRRLPSYATTLKFDVPPPPTALQVRSDLQSMVASSPQLASEDAVRVLMDGQTVVLQGQVKDDDEKRLVENMVRLTPGVHQVRNQLAPLKP